MQPFRDGPQAWDKLISNLPLPHLLQTWEWSQVKAQYGWQALPFVWLDVDGVGKPVAAAMLLKRTVSLGGFAAKLSVLYISKGPNLDWTNAALRGRVLDDLQAFARRQGAIFVKLDPDVVLGLGVPGSDQAVEFEDGQAVRTELGRRGWTFSQDQIQFRNTVLIDLAPPEGELLGRMKQKTRYNVRLAEKKGVRVRAGTAADYPLLYRMYAETSVRDGFLIRSEDYYRTVWQTFPLPPSKLKDPPGHFLLPPADFVPDPAALPRQPFHEPLIAEVEGVPVAAVSMFYFAGQAIYLFGMSRGEHREKMPNYLLQWEAMRRAKAFGCRTYNLWGAPDEFNQHDGLWNVFRFKEGLGGRAVRMLGAWDFPGSPLMYKLYTRTLPRIMDLMRRRGRIRTRQSLGV